MAEPQAPYWIASIDWKLVGGAIAGIAALLSPVVVSWWNGRLKATENAAKAAETTADRIERAQTALLDSMTKDRDHWKARAAEMELDRVADEADAENTFRDAKGMVEWAHYYRDGFYALVYRFRELSKRFEVLALGAMEQDRALQIVNDNKAAWPSLPPAVPMLRDAASKSPPREEVPP